MAKANGKTPFLDRKLKRVPSTGLGYATSTLPLSEPDTAREALETLKKVSDEWFQVIHVASTSATARSVIPLIIMTLEHLIDGVVKGIITGTIPRIEDLCEWDDKDLRDAGQNIVLDAEDDDGEWTIEAVRSLLRASEIARKSRETREAEAKAKSRAIPEQSPTAAA